MVKFDEKGDVTAAPYVIFLVTKGGKFMEYWKP